MGGWISVEDAYPDEGVKVLGYNIKSGSYGVATYSKRWEKWRAAGSTAVTHWMPLPVPPESVNIWANCDNCKHYDEDAFDCTECLATRPPSLWEPAEEEEEK